MFTQREEEVALLLLADVVSAKEIAERLVISAATARTHLTNMYQKTGTNNKASLVLWLVRRGYKVRAEEQLPAVAPLLCQVRVEENTWQVRVDWQILTPGETRVLLALLDGHYTAADLAANLFLQQSTIRFYLWRLRMKFGVSRTAGIVLWAVTHGYAVTAQLEG